MKTAGFILIGLGIIMISYTSFNFVTTERVATIGPIKINHEMNHPVQWSPIVGVVLLVGGIVIVALEKKAKI